MWLGNLPFDTPLFVVQFTTDVDLTSFARQGVNFFSQLLVGNEPCSERRPKILRRSETAEILLSWYEVYDKAGHAVTTHDRLASDPRTAPQDRIYHFYFGVRLPGKDVFSPLIRRGDPKRLFRTEGAGHVWPDFQLEHCNDKFISAGMTLTQLLCFAS